VTYADFHLLVAAGKQQRVEGDAEVEAAKVCTVLIVFGSWSVRLSMFGRHVLTFPHRPRDTLRVPVTLWLVV